MMTPSPDPNRRLRVLLVAEAANPNNTSVALIGWSFSRAIAQLTDAHLAFELRNRADIVATGLDPAEFTAIDNRRWQGAAWNIAKVLRGGTTVGWTTYSALAMLAYPFFEQKVWRQFGDRLRRGEFDLVHRVTPLAPVVPSFLAKRCAKIGVPFILGPLNGGVPWPKEFSGARRAEKEWLSYIRGAHKLLPGFHSTRKHSAAILVAARSAWAEMPPQYLPQCVFLPENAIDPNRFPRRPVAPVGTPPLRVAFVGRLVPLKGVDMLVEAAAPLVRDGKLVLDIIVGTGPNRVELRRPGRTCPTRHRPLSANGAPRRAGAKFAGKSDAAQRQSGPTPGHGVAGTGIRVPPFHLGSESPAGIGSVPLGTRSAQRQARLWHAAGVLRRPAAECVSDGWMSVRSCARQCVIRKSIPNAVPSPHGGGYRTPCRH